MSEQEVFKRLQRIASEFGYRVIVSADNYITVMRDSRRQDSKSSANFTRSQRGYERRLHGYRRKHSEVSYER